MSKILDDLIQSQYNYNVAFYIHLKEFNQNSKGVNWKFDSFGIEKAGERKTQILGFFIFRTAEVEKLKKLFTDEFKDYSNAIKISCSVAKYEKISEEFFEIEV